MSGDVATVSMAQGSALLSAYQARSSDILFEEAAAAAVRSSTYNHVQVLLETPHGRTAVVTIALDSILSNHNNSGGMDNNRGYYYDSLKWQLLQAARTRDTQKEKDMLISCCPSLQATASVGQLAIVHNGRILDRDNFPTPALQEELQCYHENSFTTTTSTANRMIVLQLKCLGRGGMDRQNRVGSKFGGGGVSSSQNAERERKDRLKQLALESIDLAKDPYLIRNHLGTYECKLCLTLHTNEANYLSHTQGKKHQQGLARRAHMEKLKEEKEQQQQQSGPMGSMASAYMQQPKTKKIRIGRPAYQVFKSRDADSNQRCLSFELQYPEIDAELQPRHRFMSAFEQRVEAPPDRRFQYLLFAAEPYETVAFKIPNEPIDKGQDKFVTHWDADDKKFTLTLYFVEQDEQAENEEEVAVGTASGIGIAAVS